MNLVTIKAPHTKHSKLTYSNTWASLLLYLLVCLSPTTVYSAPVRGYEQQLEQVRLYINNKMYEAARTELVKLSQSSNGQKDERVYIALAKVSYKLKHITKALNYLRTARKLTNEIEAKKKLSSLYEQWLNTYGLVRFEPANQVQQGKIDLIRNRKLINKERQAALEYAQDSLKSDIKLPVSLYLPYGNYTANGTSFKLKRNQPTPIVEVMLMPLAKPKAKTSSKPSNKRWLYVGLGSIALVGLGALAYSLSQEEAPPKTSLNIIISDGR